MTKEMVKKVIEKIQNDTLRQVIRIAVSDGSVSLTESKFGGIPYLPAGCLAPCNEEGQQLKLLAQINLDELPENNFIIKTGILQFWVLDDECSGVDFDDMTSLKGNRITYYKEIDPSVSEEEIVEKYHPYCEEESYFPIQNSFRLSYKLEEEGITTSDFRFNRLFKQYWNKMCPEEQIESYFDLPDDLAETLYNDYSGFGHKIGGYPAFTQEDPRDYGINENYQLLLQIDSMGTEKNEIMWGDSGVCGFFIRKEDLEKQDFTKVLYTWDCY